MAHGGYTLYAGSSLYFLVVGLLILCLTFCDVQIDWRGATYFYQSKQTTFCPD
jgi:hypothetical protein